jgi:hypothetical protein
MPGKSQKLEAAKIFEDGTENGSKKMEPCAIAFLNARRRR